jgi:hypothetical protein
MASLFGEIAKSGGGALIQHSENVREERLRDEEAQREMQLAKQRMAHDSSLTQKRIDADDRRETRRMEYETTAAEQQQKWDAETAEAEREADVEKYRYEGQVDLATAAMNAWTQQQKGGVGRGNGWTTFTEQGLDPLTGGFTTEFYAQRDGITYRQLGDKYVDAGQPGGAQIYDFKGDIGLQRKAEGMLFQGEMTATEFKDTYGYVPSSYVTGQVAQGSDLGSFLRQQNIDFARGAGGPSGGRGEPSGSTESERIRGMMQEGYKHEPGAPMRPSIEELSAGPARDAHIAAQGGKTNDEIAAEMRAEAAGETNDEIAAEMRAEAAGEAPAATGGALTEAVTQGGQLDEPAAPPVTPEQAEQATHRDPNQTPYGGRYAEGEGVLSTIYNQSPFAQRVLPLGPMGELSDEDAARIAEQIKADMAAMGGGQRTF